MIVEYDDNSGSRHEVARATGREEETGGGTARVRYTGQQGFGRVQILLCTQHLGIAALTHPVKILSAGPKWKSMFADVRKGVWKNAFLSTLFTILQCSYHLRFLSFLFQLLHMIGPWGMALSENALRRRRWPVTSPISRISLEPRGTKSRDVLDSDSDDDTVR